MNEEMFEKIKEKYDKVDWNNKQSIHEYNEYVRKLNKDKEEDNE